MVDESNTTPASDSPTPTDNLSANDARAFSSDDSTDDVRTDAEKARDEKEGQAIYNQRHPADKAAQPPE